MLTSTSQQEDSYDLAHTAEIRQPLQSTLLGPEVKDSFRMAGLAFQPSVDVVEAQRSTYTAVRHGSAIELAELAELIT